jgi:hypothetical protein
MGGNPMDEVTLTTRPELILKTGAGEIDLLSPTPEQVNVGPMLDNLSRVIRIDRLLEVSK